MLFIQFSLTVTGAVFTVALFEYYQNDLVEKKNFGNFIEQFSRLVFSYFLYRKSMTSKKISI